MENDCLFADVILPTNTKFETEDIGTDCDTGQWNVVYYERQAIQPVACESKSDMEAVGEVAKRSGEVRRHLREPAGRTLHGRQDLTRSDIQAGFENDAARPRSWTFEEFKEKQYYAVPHARGVGGHAGRPHPVLRGPGGTPAPARRPASWSTTPRRWRSQFPDDKERGPIPHWIDEGAGHQERQYLERGRKYPFLLVSNHPRWRVHANLDDVTWFREMEETCKVTGPDGYKYEPVWVNPVDAGLLGLSTGDIVKLYNERGAVLGGVRVTERIMPERGVPGSRQPRGLGGARPRRPGPRRGEQPHRALRPRTSTNAHGEVTSGFLVNIEKVDVFALAEQYPEAFGRDYEPDCGLVATARVVDGKEGE